MRQPLKYQVAPIAWAEPRDCVAIFMEKRLGKCTVAARWALARPNATRFLVVAPLSAVAGWLDEFENDGQKAFLLHPSVCQSFIDKIIEEDERHPNERLFFITNPQQLFIPKGRGQKCDLCEGSGEARHPEADDSPGMPVEACPRCAGNGKIKSKHPLLKDFAIFPWHVAILDESIQIANPKSQTNKVIFAAFADLKYKAALSGEPAPEGPHQYFEQMRWLYGSFMGKTNYWSWLNENYNQVGFDRFPKPGHLALIKAAVHARSCTLSRKAAGIEPTAATFEKVSCFLPEKLRKIYRDVELKFELPGLESGEEVETKYGLVTKMWMASMAGGYPKDYPHLHSDHKMQELVNLVTGEYKEEQLVVTFRFNSELFIAERVLAAKGVNLEVVTGATTPTRRREIQKAFKSKAIRVLLMQVKVAKYGIDLSAASTMIRYSLPENYDDISQSMDRIVHPLKIGGRHYIDLITVDTVDEDIVNASWDKRITSKYFMRAVDLNFKARLAKRMKETA